MNKLKLGCIADDFTGGSDAASFLTEGGLNTILLNGIADASFRLPEDCEAAVIALKSRTQKTEEAVNDSLNAIRWLKKQGAEQFYFKYCSTFDSTPEGNIGPVADAILTELQEHYTILCPALPANGRTVENGVLYVNGIRLEDSTMRHHPLTPMTRSRIRELMEPQADYECLEIHKDLLHDPKKAEAVISAWKTTNEYGYMIPDHISDLDAEAIVSLFGSMRFLTGGSGILKALGSFLSSEAHIQKTFHGTAGKAILVAGSCSAATRSQELWYGKNGGTMIRLSDEGILNGTQTPESLFTIIQSNDLNDVLIYSYDTPEGLAEKRNEAGRALAAKVEKTLSSTARLAADNGYRRIIAAGGETSGAVTQALGYNAFWIGQSIAPGVPVLIPVEARDIRLVLKSGNFGQEDFFTRALQITGETEHE